MAGAPIASERDLWRIWAERQFPASLQSRDGQAIRVLFTGRANSAPGPDFTGALIALGGGEVQRGDVELHLKASSWSGHGHHLDPNYDAVLLHVVLFDDGGPARTQADRIVPVLALGPLLALPPGEDQSLCGGPCMRPDAPRPSADALARLIEAAGLARFEARAATWEAEWATKPPEDCLLRALLRAVGLGRNAAACAALAAALDGATLEQLLSRSGDDAVRVATAVLLGMAGLLELSSADGDLRAAWDTYGGYWPARPLDARQWQRFRLRPANLPEVRLLALAHLLAVQGLLGLLERLRALVEAPGTTATSLMAALAVEGAGGGRGWALETWANVLLPCLAGDAAARGRRALADGAHALYLSLPGGGENKTLAGMVTIAGLARTPRRAVEQQGLLQIWQTTCSRQECASCPLAGGPPADAGWQAR